MARGRLNSEAQRHHYLNDCHTDWNVEDLVQEAVDAGFKDEIFLGNWVHDIGVVNGTFVFIASSVIGPNRPVICVDWRPRTLRALLIII